MFCWLALIVSTAHRLEQSRKPYNLSFRTTGLRPIVALSFHHHCFPLNVFAFELSVDRVTGNSRFIVVALSWVCAIVDTDYQT